MIHNMNTSSVMILAPNNRSIKSCPPAAIAVQGLEDVVRETFTLIIRSSNAEYRIIVIHGMGSDFVLRLVSDTPIQWV
jgi:hypothetical protein